MDIARGLNASVADAERIKTFYGSVLVGGSDERDMITVPHGRRGRARHAAVRAPLARSCASSSRASRRSSKWCATGSRPRLSRPKPRGRVILTGGASQLTGLPELASHIFGRPVRIGRPLGIAGLPEAAKGAGVCGRDRLLVYPQAAHLEYFETRSKRFLRSGTGGGYLARVGQWLRESF